MAITFTEAIQQAIEKELPCTAINDSSFQCKIVSFDNENKMLGILDETGDIGFIPLNNIHGITLTTNEEGLLTGLYISLPVKPPSIEELSKLIKSLNTKQK